MAENHSKTPNNTTTSNHSEQQQQQQQQTPSQPTIPPLLCASPAIFTHIPSNLDLLEPLPHPPRTPAERIQVSIEELEAQRQAVRENLLTLYRRECGYQIQVAHIAERNNTLYENRPQYDPVTVLPSEDDVNLMIRNMEREPDGANRQQQEGEDVMLYGPQLDNMVSASHRAATVKIIEKVISQGLSDLRNFEVFVAQRKKEYMDELERERRCDPDAMDTS